MSKMSGTTKSAKKKLSQITTTDDTHISTAESVPNKSPQITADDTHISTAESVPNKSPQITADDQRVLPHYTGFVKTIQEDLLVISKRANSSSTGYHYQTAVTLFQAISMAYESSKLLSFWREPQWDSIVEEGAEDIDMRSTEGHRYLMQVKYRTSDTISLTAQTSDYFKHMIYHLRLAVRNREEYLNQKVKVEYWSFAKPSPEIEKWQTELKDEEDLSEKVIEQMKCQLINMLRTVVAKEGLKADPNEITRIEEFLNDSDCLLSFLTSHFIRNSILWPDLMRESLEMLIKFIKKTFPEIKKAKPIAKELYIQLHHDLIDRNIGSSDVEMSRQPLSQREKDLCDKQQEANRLLESSPDFKELSCFNVVDLRVISKKYNVFSSNLSKRDLIMRILKEKQEIGSVQKEIRQQKIEKALKSVEKRTITIAQVKKCIIKRVEKHIKHSGQEDFESEIKKHLDLFRKWQQKSNKSSPAEWYIDSAADALAQLEEIIKNQTIPAENRAKLLSGWFSQLCLQYGSVPDSDRDRRHERENKRRMKKANAAQQLDEDLNTVHKEPKLFTGEKLIEMKNNVKILVSAPLEKVAKKEDESEKSSDDES